MDTQSNNNNTRYNPNKINESGTNNAVRSSSSSSGNTFQHQNSSLEEIDDIKLQYKNLKQDFLQNDIEKALLPQIDQWEKESIAQIRLAAKNTRNDLKQKTKTSKSSLTSLITELSKELGSKLKHNNSTKSIIERCKTLLENCQHELQQISAIKINRINLLSLPLITIEDTNLIENDNIDSSSEDENDSNAKFREIDANTTLSQGGYSVRSGQELSTPLAATTLSQQYLYPSLSFGVIESEDSTIYQLFEHLKSLSPMDKHVTMNDDCDSETTQMEKFLSKTFDFKNFPGQYIVQGVQSFRLGRSLDSMHPNALIRFPSKTTTATTNSFAMSVQEILDWQSTYVVYADRNEKGMSKEFLQRALQGQSRYGEEAFLMKFVVRISQCPILMEFDARIISRVPDETWPHNIKLVSVSGIDFAGRIHDVDDICTYLLNWQDVYEIDERSGLPLVYNGRDFRQRANGPQGQLDEQRLLYDLIRMIRLRLRACDLEKVEIVVETGIGLGVFAGKDIGIDEKVQMLSALAIQTVLEEDGPSYQNILGVVFALPIFDVDLQNDQRKDTYHTFAEVFSLNQYQGSIPVFIADQDMHRLTVAIARLGFTVSELNPTDSHGIFGEYWQNRGPAVEEKLALTTVGLLVQHHLINPHVLDPNHYHLI